MVHIGLLGNYPVGELSVGELPIGELFSRGTVCESGGTDMHNQRMGFYTTKAKFYNNFHNFYISWTQLVLMHQQFLPWKITKIQQDIFKFLENLVKQTVEPFLFKVNVIGWGNHCKMYFLIKDKYIVVQAHKTPKNENGERCNICFSKTAGFGKKYAKNSKCRWRPFIACVTRLSACRKHMIHIS